MELNNAIELLKDLKKDSHLASQPHLDLTLVNAEARPKYQKALMIVQVAIKNGELSEEDFKIRLGLK